MPACCLLGLNAIKGQVNGKQKVNTKVERLIGFPTSFPHVLFSNNWRCQGDSNLHFGLHTRVQNYCCFRYSAFYVILLRTYNLCDKDYKKLVESFALKDKYSFIVAFITFTFLQILDSIPSKETRQTNYPNHY